MKEIIIGRNGTQKLKISAEGVSGQHASLTIRDDGKWVLKDLDSTNGTFIRNENYQFERIAVKIINKDTVIRLGNDDSIRSFQFTANQLVKEDPNDYSYEFEMLRKRWNETIAKRDAIEKRVTLLSFAPIACSIMVWLSTSNFNFEPNTIRLQFFVPTILSPLANMYGKRKLKTLVNEIKNTFVCPNPKCGMLLSEAEIKKGQCQKCKCHI